VGSEYDFKTKSTISKPGSYGNEYDVKTWFKLARVRSQNLALVPDGVPVLQWGRQSLAVVRHWAFAFFVSCGGAVHIIPSPMFQARAFSHMSLPICRKGGGCQCFLRTNMENIRMISFPTNWLWQMLYLLHGFQFEKVQDPKRNSILLLHNVALGAQLPMLVGIIVCTVRPMMVGPLTVILHRCSRMSTKVWWTDLVIVKGGLSLP
jgi:hypothetical protein